MSCPANDPTPDATKTDIDCEWVMQNVDVENIQYISNHTVTEAKMPVCY